jgi:hypothetical protein
MALSSIANLNESFANQTVGHGKDAQAVTNSGGTSTSAPLTTPIVDSFTQSPTGNSGPGSAQEAGLFQVKLFPVLATFDTTQPQSNQNPTTAQIAPVAATSGGDVVTATTPAAVATPPAVGTHNQIQAFNQALAALGLTNIDILRLDQIATLVNSFNPAAFTDLISQLQALAQQAAQKPAPNSPLASANSGSNQVQGLSLHFSGAQTSLNVGVGLRLERVQFILTNGPGQAVNVLAAQNANTAAKTHGTPA